jgi:hypothetical protein
MERRVSHQEAWRTLAGLPTRRYDAISLPVTFRQKLLLGVLLLILPAVVIGVGAIRSSRVSGAPSPRSRPGSLGPDLRRLRYDVRPVGAGLADPRRVDSSAIREVPLRRQVVAYRFAQCRSQLDSQDLRLGHGVSALRRNSKRSPIPSSS